MSNSNIQLGIQQAHMRHIHCAQNVIDGIVQAKNTIHNELFNDLRNDDSMYAIDLDATGDFVLGDDLHEARIFPSRKTNRLTPQVQINTQEFEIKLKYIGQKVFDLSQLLIKLVITFLTKLDFACENILTKGNKYIQSTAKAISERQQAEIIQAVQQVVPTTPVATVQKTVPIKPLSIVVQTESVPTESVQTERRDTKLLIISKNSNTVVPVRSVANQRSEQKVIPPTPEIIKQKENKVIFFEVVRILYSEIRYGKKERVIDSR